MNTETEHTKKRRQTAQSQNLEEADQVWIKKIVSGGCCFEAASVTGTCLGEQYNIEEQMQFYTTE